MTQEQIQAILQRITLGPTVLFASQFTPPISFSVTPVPGKYEDICAGFWVQLHFARPDTNTGAWGWGESRREYIAPNATEDSILKTGFLLLKLVVEHELMEAFLVDGVRIFDPHRSVHAHQQADEYEQQYRQMEAS